MDMISRRTDKNFRGKKKKTFISCSYLTCSLHTSHTHTYIHVLRLDLISFIVIIIITTSYLLSPRISPRTGRKISKVTRHILETIKKATHLKKIQNSLSNPIRVQSSPVRSGPFWEFSDFPCEKDHVEQKTTYDFALLSHPLSSRQSSVVL